MVMMIVHEEVNLMTGSLERNESFSKVKSFRSENKLQEEEVNFHSWATIVWPDNEDSLGDGTERDIICGVFIIIIIN